MACPWESDVIDWLAPPLTVYTVETPGTKELSAPLKVTNLKLGSASGDIVASVEISEVGVSGVIIFEDLNNGVSAVIVSAFVVSVIISAVVVSAVVASV